MKVTALIPDDLVSEIRHLSRGKNLTDSLILALDEWRSMHKLRMLSERIRKRPLAFKRNYSARSVRSLTRTK